MMEYPVEFSYSKHHLWVKADDKRRRAVVGITEHLAEELGEILGVDLPLRGDELDMETICIHLHLESDIDHLSSPLSGRVVEINKEVLDSPSLLHLAPYKHWLYRMEYDEPEELELLMSATQYASYLDHL